MASKQTRTKGPGYNVPALFLPLFTRVRGRCILRSSFTKTCIAPVSSITDHRRLMYVAILAQLSKHEVRDVLRDIVVAL